jgi:hypothetical protein
LIDLLCSAQQVDGRRGDAGSDWIGYLSGDRCCGLRVRGLRHAEDQYEGKWTHTFCSPQKGFR